MNGLILHCGAQGVDRAGLARLPVPEPIGPYHVPRPFIDDVELVTDFMDHQGIRVQQEAFGIVYKDDLPAKFFGVMQVAVPGTSDANGYGLLVGLRGSYDGSISRSLAVGSRVFVCDNMAFSGEVHIQTRQTTNIANRIPALLESAVGQLPGMVEHQERRFEAYRNTQTGRAAGDALLTDLVRKGVLNPSQLGKAIAEWDHPSHEEHAEQGLSIWRLHNAVTEAIKPSNPERNALPGVWQRTRVLTDELDQAVGLRAAA